MRAVSGPSGSNGSATDRRDRRSKVRTSPEKLFAEINWDYAVIERLNEADLSTTLIPFNLGKAILEGDPTQNLVLKPGDIVTIFSKEDINVPVARQTKLIRLEGEFNHAGVYQAQSGETIRQLIALAGGTTRRADKAQIFVLRADGSAAGQTGGVLGLGSGVSGTITPGDTIVVPEDYYRATFTRDLKDWTQIFYQFGLGVAAIKVLRQ